MEESHKDDTSHPVDQTHSSLDATDSQNPPDTVQMKGEEAQETPKDVTAPSGDNGAQVKDKEEVLIEQQLVAEKEEAEKNKAQEKGEQITVNVPVVTAIDTPKDKGKRILLQISINFDKPIDIGQMSPTERLMVAAAVQAQASQDLVNLKNEDKKLIQMSIDVLHKVVLDLQLDSNANPSSKLLQLINNVNTNFESLEKSTTKQVLDRFKEVCMQTL